MTTQNLLNLRPRITPQISLILDKNPSRLRDNALIPQNYIYIAFATVALLSKAISRL